MVRVQVWVLFARDGPFDVNPAASLHGVAGIHHAWDMDMSRTDLGVGQLVRPPVLRKDGLHGRISLPVRLDRVVDWVDRRIANRHGDRGEAADADDTGAGGDGDKAPPRRIDGRSYAILRINLSHDLPHSLGQARCYVLGSVENQDSPLRLGVIQAFDG